MWQMAKSLNANSVHVLKIIISFRIFLLVCDILTVEFDLL